MKNAHTVDGDVVTMMVQGLPVMFDAADMPLVGQYRWKRARKSSVNTGYRDAVGVGRTVTLHKLITGSRFVKWQNGNDCDYRRSNLIVSERPTFRKKKGVRLKGNEYRIEGNTVIVIIKSKGDIYEAYIDYEDYPLISGYTWCRNVATGYAQSIDRLTRKGVYMHRLVIGADGFYAKTDHISGNKLDNRKANLRSCDDSQNHHNTIRHRAGVAGVSRHTAGGWTARLQVNGVVHRKYFKNFDDAVEQYRTWERELNPSGLEE
jgi:hypothetical protein